MDGWMDGWMVSPFFEVKYGALNIKKQNVNMQNECQNHYEFYKLSKRGRRTVSISS